MGMDFGQVGGMVCRRGTEEIGIVEERRVRGYKKCECSWGEWGRLSLGSGSSGGGN